MNSGEARLDFVDEVNESEILTKREYYIQVIHAMLMREAYYIVRLSFTRLTGEECDFVEWQMRLTNKALMIVTWEAWMAGHQDIVVTALDPSTLHDIVIAMS